jgi:hypothetical protein
MTPEIIKIYQDYERGKARRRKLSRIAYKLDHSTIIIPMKRNCDNCKKEYEADERNLNRGWGLCCSKSCAASKREKSKPGYNPIRVARNNVRRVLWNDFPPYKDSYETRREYEADYDPGDSEYWDNSDNGTP